MKERTGQHRKIILNPDEPRTGDYAYSVYDNAHPDFGDQETIRDLKKQLAGLRGEVVTITVKGAHIDKDGEERVFRRTRSFVYRNYRDVFGPGSAYADIIHAVRDENSEDELVAFSMEVDIDYDADPSEFLEED